MQVITLHFSLYFSFDFPSRISVFLYNTDNYATMPYTSLFQVISTNFRCIAGNSHRNSNYIELSSHTYRRRINLKKNIIGNKIKYFTGALFEFQERLSINVGRHFNIYKSNSTLRQNRL